MVKSISMPRYNLNFQYPMAQYMKEGIGEKKFAIFTKDLLSMYVFGANLTIEKVDGK